MNKEQLVKQIKEKRSFLCVGLDSDIKKMPACIKDNEDAIFDFNKAIIDATAPYTVAYKPNLAFYEAFGVKGWISFEKTVKYIKENYPEIFIIADAKRGDIGNTSALYARSFFEEMKVDSITVAPYMGEDSVKPFLAYDGTWVILLALTSNPGSHDFQLTKDEDGTMLFEKVLAIPMSLPISIANSLSNPVQLPSASCSFIFSNIVTPQTRVSFLPQEESAKIAPVHITNARISEISFFIILSSFLF